MVNFDLSKKNNKRSGSFNPRIPFNGMTPVISGTAITGQTLSTTDGYWLNKPTSFTYQWYANGVAIGGATANTYVIQASDAGKVISVIVTATNLLGSTAAPTATVVTPTIAAPTNTVAPVISGTGTVGQTLTSTNGTWTGTPTYTYQWRRGGTAIAGATASTYVLAAPDSGTSVTLAVTGNNAGGNATAVSNAIAVA